MGQEAGPEDAVTLVPPDFFEALMAELDAPAEQNNRLAAAARRARTVVDQESWRAWHM